MDIQTETIMRGRRTAWLAKPHRAVRSGVLVLPPVHGIEPASQRYAIALAQAGLAALIWEPFRDQPPADTREQRGARLATLTDSGSLGDMTAWLDYLAGELSLTAIGAAGFCLGGRYGLLLAAKDRRIAACVSYYPTIEVPPLPGQDEDVVALAATIPCPVHMVRAGKDHLTSDAVFLRLQSNLQRRTAPTSIQVYPEGDHGFMQRGGSANQTAIRLAMPQTVAFLAAALI